jgi:hypothetical protein
MRLFLAVFAGSLLSRYLAFNTFDAFHWVGQSRRLNIDEAVVTGSVTSVAPIPLCAVTPLFSMKQNRVAH